MAASGTATSTTSMVACCLHHLSEVLPIIGLSGAAVFFTTYKVPVIVIGLATNGLGIGLMVRAIRHHHRAARPGRAVGQAAAGGVPAIAGAAERRPALARPDAIRQAGYTVGRERLLLQITGMSCASCAASIEAAVGGLPGVASAAVNFGAGTAAIEYDPGVVTPAQIKRTVRDLGYEAAERLEGAAALDREREARQREIVRQGRWMLVAWPPSPGCWR